MPERGREQRRRSAQPVAYCCARREARQDAGQPVQRVVRERRVPLRYDESADRLRRGDADALGERRRRLEPASQTARCSSRGGAVTSSGRPFSRTSTEVARRTASVDNSPHSARASRRQDRRRSDSRDRRRASTNSVAGRSRARKAPAAAPCRGRSRGAAATESSSCRHAAAREELDIGLGLDNRPGAARSSARSARLRRDRSRRQRDADWRKSASTAPRLHAAGV